MSVKEIFSRSSVESGIKKLQDYANQTGENGEKRLDWKKISLIVAMVTGLALTVTTVVIMATGVLSSRSNFSVEPGRLPGQKQAQTAPEQSPKDQPGTPPQVEAQTQPDSAPSPEPESSSEAAPEGSWEPQSRESIGQGGSSSTGSGPTAIVPPVAPPSPTIEIPSPSQPSPGTPSPSPDSEIGSSGPGMRFDPYTDPEHGTNDTRPPSENDGTGNLLPEVPDVEIK
ncbi:MAG: hypothetical protein M1355_01835 [Patescibacteria group bacterium]|nr:hypothetical protein [Patescibacteria group bacterium]